MSLKKRACNLHIIDFVSLVVSVILFFACGLASVSLLSGEQGAISGSLVSAFSFAKGHLLGSVLVYLSIVLFIVGVVLLILKAVKNKKNGLFVNLVFLIIWSVILFFGALLINAYQVEISKYVISIFSQLNSGSATAYGLFFGFLLFTIAIVVYLIGELFVFLEVLAYAGRPVEDYNEDPDYLSEEQVRQIIKEELEKYYGNQPAEEKPAEEPVAEEKPAEEPVAEEKPAVEPVAEEKPAEQPTEGKKTVEEPVVEEKPAEEPVVEEKPAEEPVVEEKPAEEPEEPESQDDGENTKPVKDQLASLHLTPTDLDGNGRISFCERLLVVDDDILDIYNVLKNKLISYGVNSRLSSSGDTFRLHRQTYAKITISGKKIKIYLALNPDDYKDSTIPFMDVGHKKTFVEIPFAFKVKSGLSIRRACELIDATMARGGIDEKHEPENVDYGHDLVEQLKEIRDAK